MANKDFKVKNGLDISTPLPISMGGTGQTSSNNTLNALLPVQTSNSGKFLTSDGSNTSWATPAKGLTSGSTAQRPGSPSNGDLYFNTDEQQIEVYQNGNWLIANITPGIPTGVTATNQGTGRAYNNGQASVAFTASTSGGPVKTFTVTPSPATSPTTFTGTSSPISVTGLSSSTQYTYTVTAGSNIGTSSASSASSGVTATTVPQAPTIGTATATNAQSDVAFTAGATGGSSITSYTVTSSPGSITASGASSPITVTGLTNGTTYTFTVTATNANGTSSASSASNSVVPSAYTSAFEPIATVTVGAGGSSTVSFNSIPSTYTHLQVRCMARTASTNGTYDGLKLQFNSDTASNYADHALYYTGTTGGVSYTSPNSYIWFEGIPDNGALTNNFGAGVLDILDYANTNKYKVARFLNGFVNNEVGASNYQKGFGDFGSGQWRSTSAISSITFTPSSGSNFAQYTTFALYGIKG